MYNRKRNSKDFKLLNKIAVPLIIQNIACMLIGIVDEGFVGHISSEAYTGIGLSVSLLNFIAGVCGYFAIAFNISGARKVGEENSQEFKELLLSSLLLDAVFGVLYIVFMLAFSTFIFSYAYGLEGDTLHSTVQYAIITSPCLLAQMFIFTMNSFFKICKKTSKLMVVSVGCSLLNVGLDYVLIFGKMGFPELGVRGAAIATVCSVFINALVLLLFARKDIIFVGFKLKCYLKKALRLMKESIPLIGEELLEGSVFVVGINMIVSNMGVVQAGGYILTKNLLEFVMISVYMYGNAELTLVSEKCGKQSYDTIIQLARLGVYVSIAIYVILGGVLVALKNVIPNVITDDASLVTYSSMLMIPMVLINIFNPVQTIYKYVLQACDDAKFVLYVSAGINLVAFVFMLLLKKEFEIYAVLLCLFINYALISVVFVVRLRKLLLVPFHKS